MVFELLGEPFHGEDLARAASDVGLGGCETPLAKRVDRVGSVAGGFERNDGLA